MDFKIIRSVFVHYSIIIRACGLGWSFSIRFLYFSMIVYTVSILFLYCFCTFSMLFPYLGGLGALLGKSWESLERSWGDLGTLLGPSLEPLRVVLELSWGYPGAVLGRLGCVLGVLGGAWRSSWGILGRLRTVLFSRAS